MLLLHTGHSCWSCFHGSKARTARRPGCAGCLRLGEAADRKTSTKGTFALELCSCSAVSCCGAEVVTPAACTCCHQARPLAPQQHLLPPAPLPDLHSSLWAGCTRLGMRTKACGCAALGPRARGDRTRAPQLSCPGAALCPLAGPGLSVHWEVNKWRTSLLRFSRLLTSVFSIK